MNRKKEKLNHISHLPHHTSNSGITLIALVVTIIVMLILVAVTIAMSVNGGLFDYAGKAVSDTQNAIDEEQDLGSGKVTVDNKLYDSIDDYLAGTPAGEPKPYDKTAKDETTGVLKANAIYKSGEYTAVIPKGFKISDVEGETAIATGLVIKDANNNEFVWIPVEDDIGAAYDYDEIYYEPKELKGDYSSSSAAYDSQTTLDYLYGKDYYTYTEDFKYAEEYAEMVEKVNLYNGFYIGRYETTIDSDGNIGSKYNTQVLTAGTTLFTKDSTNYPYRWYGLYQAGKNADVSGNGIDVQTAMIYGVLYDEAMQFIRDQKTAGNTTYNVDSSTPIWHGSSNGHTGVVNSAQANPGATGDVALNIWDLESNAWEWTQETYSTNARVFRGGYYNNHSKASLRFYNGPTSYNTYNSSRLALYLQ